MKDQVTLADIARHCQVAQSTVSLALQGAPRVNPATRARILAAADALGYNPHAHEAARRLARHRHGLPSRTGLIATIFPHGFLELNYFASLFHGISATLMQKGYGMLAVSLPEKPGLLSSMLPPPLQRGEVDAAIVYKVWHDLLDFLTQQTMGCPVVKFINPQDGMSCITMDSRHGMYLAAQHLLGLGHREILYVSYEEDSPDSTARRAGITQAMEEVGVDPRRAFHAVAYTPTPLQRVACTDSEPTPCPQVATLEYLRTHPGVTGVLCSNDIIARHTWYTLRQAGYRIPGDYSLVGCDDTDPLLNEYGQNALTTIRFPLHDMGEAAAQVAINRLTGYTPSDVIQTFPAELVIRASTAPPLSRV